MRTLCAVVVALAALGGLACTSNKTAVQPPATAQIDTAAIRKAGQARLDAIAAGQTDGYLAAYAEDAVWMPPNVESYAGKAVASKRLSGALDEMSIRAILETQEQTVMAPDWVLERGKYTIVRTPRKAGAASETEVGSYLTIWKRQADQSFKIAYDMWHSDRPPVADKQ